MEITSWSGKYDDRPFAIRNAVDKIKKVRRRYEVQIRASHAWLVVLQFLLQWPCISRSSIGIVVKSAMGQMRTLIPGSF